MLVIFYSKYQNLIRSIYLRTFIYSFLKTLSWRWMSSRSPQVLYLFHLIAVKAVKLTSTSRWCKIYFCNDIMYWDPTLSTRPKELCSRTIYVEELNVHIKIFYQNIVLLQQSATHHQENKHKTI